jgi:hypothetical protein
VKSELDSSQHIWWQRKSLQQLGNYSTEKIGKTTVSGSYYPDEKKID